MSAFFTAIFFVLLSLGIVRIVMVGREQRFVSRVLVIAWICALTLVEFANYWLPFTVGGDDVNYFYLASTTQIDSITEIFDISRFRVMEQPGFPWVLSLLNILVEPNEVVYKLLNLFFFVILAITWYRIGILLESPEFGRGVLIGILLLTPLWNYVFFLLKDMTITLLQSLFLLGTVQLWQRNTRGSWLLIGLATLALLPFRAPLVLQNAAVLVLALLFKLFARERKGGRIVPLIFGSVMLASVLLIASNPIILESFGVKSAHRVVGSEEMIDNSQKIHSESTVNRVLFPLIYIFTEVTGLKPESWEVLDEFWLRGVLALPWILFVVPFFIVGVHWVLQAPPNILCGKGWVARLRGSRLINTPWGVLLMFMLSMMAISWQVGDTTRWRIPDMPVIATIAMAGWTFAKPGLRQLVFIFWGVGGVVLFSLYYAIKTN